MRLLGVFRWKLSYFPSFFCFIYTLSVFSYFYFKSIYIWIVKLLYKCANVTTSAMPFTSEYISFHFLCSDAICCFCCCCYLSNLRIPDGIYRSSWKWYCYFKTAHSGQSYRMTVQYAQPYSHIDEKAHVYYCHIVWLCKNEWHTGIKMLSWCSVRLIVTSEKRLRISSLSHWNIIHHHLSTKQKAANVKKCWREQHFNSFKFMFDDEQLKKWPEPIYMMELDSFRFIFFISLFPWTCNEKRLPKETKENIGWFNGHW